VKIREIRAFELNLKPAPFGDSKAVSTRPRWQDTAEIANPMSRYPKYKPLRSLWTPGWGGVGCLVTAEDGTWGLGMSRYGKPVIEIINGHFAPRLEGENCMATEKIWDMMFRLASPYSTPGLASYAISAVDLALWDLKGKLLKKPVYELLGGPARDRQVCYATGFDTDWHMELGFKATKVPCPYGAADGLAGLEKDEELVAKTRELVGPSVDVMLDCWMAFDVEFTIRLVERLRPYGLRWLEDCLIPEDLDSFVEMRRRVPWQNMAGGEHWYTPLPFSFAASRRLLEVFQPDIEWVGGVTALVKICHIAEAAGISVIPHGGMETAYGQHVSFAMPSTPWGEYILRTPPGVPLQEAPNLPGVPVPNDGFLVPNNAPGFGLEVDLAWLEERAM